MSNPTAALNKEVTKFFDTFLWRDVMVSKINKEFPKSILKAPLGYYPDYRLQIVAPAGIGKTTSVIKQLERCKGKVVWFMVPTLKLANELKKEIRENSTQELYDRAFVIEGRSPNNCDLYDLAKTSRLCHACLEIF